MVSSVWPCHCTSSLQSIPNMTQARSDPLQQQRLHAAAGAGVPQGFEFLLFFIVR